MVNKFEYVDVKLIASMCTLSPPCAGWMTPAPWYLQSSALRGAGPPVWSSPSTWREPTWEVWWSASSLSGSPVKGRCWQSSLATTRTAGRFCWWISVLVLTRHSSCSWRRGWVGVTSVTSLWMIWSCCLVRTVTAWEPPTVLPRPGRERRQVFAIIFLSCLHRSVVVVPWVLSGKVWSQHHGVQSGLGGGRLSLFPGLSPPNLLQGLPICLPASNWSQDWETVGEHSGLDDSHDCRHCLHLSSPPAGAHYQAPESKTSWRQRREPGGCWENHWRRGGGGGGDGGGQQENVRRGGVHWLHLGHGLRARHC